MKKIHKLNRIMKRTTLYISRCSNSGTSTNSAPCAKCLEVIQSFHIRKIVFHMNDDYYEYNPRDFETNHRTFGELTLLEKNKSQ